MLLREMPHLGLQRQGLVGHRQALVSSGAREWLEGNGGQPEVRRRSNRKHQGRRAVHSGGDSLWGRAWQTTEDHSSPINQLFRQDSSGASCSHRCARQQHERPTSLGPAQRVALPPFANQAWQIKQGGLSKELKVGTIRPCGRLCGCVGCCWSAPARSGRGLNPQRAWRPRLTLNATVGIGHAMSSSVSAPLKSSDLVCSGQATPGAS